MQTISMTDEDGKEYEFEKPENIVIKVYEAFLGSIYGRMDNYVAKWTLDGVCIQIGANIYNVSKYNLTPIKPKWYEDEDNFPAMLTRKDGTSIDICWTKEYWVYQQHDYKLSTKQEVDSFYYEGK